MTLGTVSQVKAPPTQRATLQRVQRALAMLAGFYQQASAAPRGSLDLLAAIAAGEAAARKEARRAALPACVVSRS